MFGLLGVSVNVGAATNTFQQTTGDGEVTETVGIGLIVTTFVLVDTHPSVGVMVSVAVYVPVEG